MKLLNHDLFYLLFNNFKLAKLTPNSGSFAPWFYTFYDSVLFRIPLVAALLLQVTYTHLFIFMLTSYMYVRYILHYFWFSYIYFLNSVCEILKTRFHTTGTLFASILCIPLLTHSLNLLYMNKSHAFSFNFCFILINLQNIEILHTFGQTFCTCKSFLQLPPYNC